MRGLKAICLLVFAIAATYILFVVIADSARDTTPPKVDAKLEELVSDWQREMQDAGLEYRPAFNRLESIELSSEKEPWAGVTEVSTRRIKINPKQLSSGYYRAKASVYHELGHWVFCLGHVEGTVMQEKCPSEEELQENWQDYINDYLQLCNNNSINAKY